MAERAESMHRRVVLLTVLGALAQVMSFGYRVVMSRMVGAEVMGLYQLVISAYGVVQSITTVGLTAALSNLTARYLAQKNRAGAVQARNTCLRMFFLLLIPVGAVVILASDAISVFCLGDARTQLGLILMIPCAALTGIENLHKNIFYGAGRPLGPALAELVEQLVRAAAVLGLLMLCLPQYPERVVGLILTGMVLCEVVSATTMLGMYRHDQSGTPLTGPGEDRRECRRQVTAIAVPVGLNALFGTLLGAANSALLPQKLLQTGMERSQAISQLGVVSGMTLPMLAAPTVFLGALNLVLMPRMAAAFALNQRQEVGRLTGSGLKTVSRLAFPIMTMMVILGRDLGVLLFGREDVGCHLLPLAAAMLMSCYNSVLTGVLNSVGQQRTVAAISIFGGIVQLVCTMLFTGLPGVGIGGYVFGMVLASGLELLLHLWVVLKKTKVKPAWGSWFLIPGLASALAGATANLLILSLKGDGVWTWGANLAGSIFSVIQYLLALYVMGSAEEKNPPVKSRGK